MSPKVIFEDEYILMLDKPSGWIVNEAETTGNNPVVQTWLSETQDYLLAKSKENRSGIVHRLDKQTSGILVVAKTKDAFAVMQQHFKERKVEKTYNALVHGKLEPAKGELKVPVGRLPWNRERFGILPGGRESETNFNVISNYSNDKETFSLVEFYPKTGRTHQIRIHAKYLGHPIVSDELYAGRKTSRNDKKWCQRLFLHASKISFPHPSTKKKAEFVSGLPSDLGRALASLEKIS
jgi:23S rRNA pseudouridine1911/1915/1917 synthase